PWCLGRDPEAGGRSVAEGARWSSWGLIIGRLLAPLNSSRTCGPSADVRPSTAVTTTRAGKCRMSVEAAALDGTIHTDFSHVEVDTAEVNLTRFPLLFPEKREFFLENADLFNLVPYGWSGDVGVDGETRIGTYGRVDGYWLRSDAAGTTGQAR